MAFLILEIPYVQKEIYVVLTFMYLIMYIYLSASSPACLPANFVIFLFIRLFISVLVGLIVCSCFYRYLCMFSRNLCYCSIKSLSMLWSCTFLQPLNMNCYCYLLLDHLRYTCSQNEINYE